MSRVDLACLGMVILGFVLFLYGANFYDVVIGWVGVYLIIGGIMVFLLFYIYNELTKKAEVQNL
jgi:ABC-type bacteriocin/lantibiotic exporter with double-glycine peptidase domain